MRITSRTFIQPLHVEELTTNEETRREIQLLARSWQTLSIEKLDSATTDLEGQTYAAARTVNLVSFQRASRIANFTRTFSVVVCYGMDLNIRGFAFIKPLALPIQRNVDIPSQSSQNFLHLNYLSSDPKILCEKNRMERKWLLYRLFFI